MYWFAKSAQLFIGCRGFESHPFLKFHTLTPPLSCTPLKEKVLRLVSKKKIIVYAR